jgi:hypothetical protein
MRAICLGRAGPGASLSVGPCRQAARAPEDARLLGCRQTLSRHIQIGQPAADMEPVSVLREPAVPDSGPSKDPLDHQERMFDLCPDRRLRPVPGPLRLIQRPMAMGFRLHEALGPGGEALNHITLPAIGRVAPHPRLLAMEQLGQHLAVVHVRRRGRHGVNQLRLAIHANMRLRTGGDGKPDRRRAGHWSQCVGTLATRVAPVPAAGL